MPFVSGAPKNFAQIVRDICLAVGVEFPGTIIPTAATPSTDLLILRICQAVYDATDKLITMRAWNELKVTATITVVADFAGQTEKGFALPADFYGFVDQTQNDSTMRLPAVGPLDSQRWQAIQTLAPQVSFSILWRYDQGQVFFLYPPTAPGRTFQYEYITRALWRSANGADTAERPQTNEWTPVLDPVLVTLLAKAKYLEGSGFDASAAMRDFDEAYATRATVRESAPVANMAGAVVDPLRLLTVANLPQTNYGV